MFELKELNLIIPLLGILVMFCIYLLTQRNKRKQFVTQKLEEMYATIEEITKWKTNMLMLYAEALVNIRNSSNEKIDLDVDKISDPTQKIQMIVNYCPGLRPYTIKVLSACDDYKKGLYDFFYLALEHKKNPGMEYSHALENEYMAKPINNLDNSLNELKMQLDKRLQKF